MDASTKPCPTSGKGTCGAQSARVLSKTLHRTISVVLLWLIGAPFYLSYISFLLFDFNPLGVTGLALYWMATVGGLAIGIAVGFSRNSLATIGAVGFALLSLMRLVTIPWGMDVLTFIPSTTAVILLNVGETLVFSALAWRFWREMSCKPDHDHH